jgi:hypothetical protein
MSDGGAPTVGAPAWATLRVVKGGFATGGLLAGGPLEPHERDLLARLGDDDQDTARARLNAYYLGEEGLAELDGTLASGRYRVRLPEEGALLAVAWLLRHELAGVVHTRGRPGSPGGAALGRRRVIERRPATPAEVPARPGRPVDCPRFDIDEADLPTAIDLLVGVVERYLGGER